MRKIILYTDGSSLGNPGPGGWGAVALTPSGEVVELGGRHAHTTNNRMELTAALGALREFLPQGLPIEIRTDSSYLVNGAGKWLSLWEERGWLTTAKKPVENRELWEDLSSLLKLGEVSFRHVSAHRGVPGNERADTIARTLASGEKIPLFRGKTEDYRVDLLKHSPAQAKPKSGKAYGYLSMVKGLVERHHSWEECARRVRGLSRARYRKIYSAKEEEEVRREWARGTSR